MKKMTTLAVTLFAAMALNAQVQQGAIVLMGGGGINSYTSTDMGGGNSDETKTNYSFLNFGGMYLLTEQIGVGLNVNSTNWRGEQDGKKNYKQSMFGATVMGRYYSNCGSERFYTYGQVDFGFASGSNEEYDIDGNVNTEYSDDVSSLSFGIRPGILYFLTPSVSIEANFGALEWNKYTYTNQMDNDYKTEDTSLDFFALSTSLNFGFSWWLGRKGEKF